MNLLEIYNTYPHIAKSTDKGTVHSYLGVYNEILAPYQHSAKNVLEIGIFAGGSIELWNRYFTKAHITGVDINIPFPIKEYNGISLIEADAYTSEFTSSFNTLFDVIIDDGPHTIESQVAFIHLYWPLLAAGGIMVIEDIQSEADLILLRKFGNIFTNFWSTYDLRGQKERYDDILLVLRKGYL